jgi:putative transcriptional regulator
MHEQKVAPGLLLAMPQLADPNFSRSAVLMIEHTDEGSFGLILNRSTNVAVAEVLKAFGMEWIGPADARVWLGGPVMPQSRWALHSPVELRQQEGSFTIVEGVTLSTQPTQHQQLVEQPPPHLRFLLGYSGWGAGQLESELAQGSWLIAEATEKLVFETGPDEMWEAAIRSLGIDPVTLFPGAGVH